MSLHPHSQLSRSPKRPNASPGAAFPKGTLCLRIADQLGSLYRDDQFAELFPTRGQPAASPARLALASVLQYVEGLSDRQAADAVRGRIDWKYALALELTDPGFDHTVLSEFRSRLVQGQAELAAPGHPPGSVPRTRPDPPTGAGSAPIRPMSWPPCACSTGWSGSARPCGPLNELAVMAPDWLQAAAPAEWYRPLWPAGRELPPAQDRCGPRGAGPGDRGRWRDPARRR